MDVCTETDRSFVIVCSETLCNCMYRDRLLKRIQGKRGGSRGVSN